MGWLDMSFDASKLAGAASSFVTWLEYILIAVGVLLIVWGIFYILSFKNLVRVRQQTASGYVIIDTKAREFTTKQGIKKWRFLKWIKTSYLAPSREFLEFTRKGKFSAECDRDTDGSVFWRQRGKKPDDLDNFTSEERLVTIDDIKRAHEYNKQSGWDKLWQMAPVIACIIIVVLIFAFWGDFVKGTTGAADKVAYSADKLAIASDRLAESNNLMACALHPEFCRVGPNGTMIVDNQGRDLPPIPN